MRLWIDNTGLHGAGKCLVGQATTIYDVKGLLQFATLIVFADLIELGDFEPSEIAETSMEFRDLVRGMGVPDTTLSIHNTSREDYALACSAAADFASDELEYQFQADERLVLGLPEANLPRGAQFRPDRTEWLAAEVTNPGDIERINETALDTKAGGAIDYMLSGSAPLRNAVCRLMNADPAWSHGHTFQVESMLRAYLNHELARQVGATYAPAAHRADVISRQNEWLLNQLSGALDPTVDELRPEPLGIPSLVEALIRKSRGDPKGLINEALKMRKRAAALRASLFELQKAAAKDDPSAQHNVRREVADLARGVRVDLGLESPWDAIVLQAPLGSPPRVSMPLTALLDWMRLRWSKSKRAVLTDAVKAAAYSGVDRSVYRKLAGRSAARGVAIDNLDLPRLS